MTDQPTNVDTESFAVISRLKDMRLEHRDLDQAIRSLEEQPSVDQIQIRRLKKRKLLLKDQITHLESDLIPDLDA
jgi:hypothetical protein